jgi:hypothetical protein
MTDKEAMKLALDALETEVSIDWTNNDEFNASAEKMHEAIAALKERLADPMREVQRLGQEIEQEPVCPDCKAKVLYECVACSSNNYPPQRTEQEPVAKYIGECKDGSLVQLYDDVKKGTKFYTTPPQRTEPAQRTWVGLTGDEYAELAQEYGPFAINRVEAKLKEKNT